MAMNFFVCFVLFQSTTSNKQTNIFETEMKFNEIWPSTIKQLDRIDRKGIPQMRERKWKWKKYFEPKSHWISKVYLYLESKMKAWFFRKKKLSKNNNNKNEANKKLNSTERISFCSDCFHLSFLLFLRGK